MIHKNFAVVSQAGDFAESYFLEHVYRNVHKLNQNFLMVITGKPGSSKTYSAMKLCQKLDPTFDVSRIVFNVESFMRLITNDLPKGSAILFDEIGTAVSSRKSMSKRNRAFTEVMQTFRHKNYVLLMTAPSIKMVDVQVRQVAHAQGVARGFNPNTCLSLVTIYGLEHDEFSGKQHLRHFRVFSEGTLRVNSLLLGKPDSDLIDAYELKKQNFTHSLNLRVSRTLDVLENDEFKDVVDENVKSRKVETTKKEQLLNGYSGTNN